MLKKNNIKSSTVVLSLVLIFLGAAIASYAYVHFREVRELEKSAQAVQQLQKSARELQDTAKKEGLKPLDDAMAKMVQEQEAETAQIQRWHAERQTAEKR